ncbi:Protein of unknown function [Spirosomataceae bacterium TFI 002]|nr:Protein of unknown function [Spirosomataceae bacterium TFI 002]
MEFLLFILALVIGGLAAWQIFVWRYGANKKNKNKADVKVESNILLERIEKVFKVVFAEGYFTEIYDHKSNKDFWGIFQSNKKALIVTKAKVSVGYDFSKMKIERDETTRKITVLEFPEPEVISMDTDYKFYDINQGWLHKFKSDDYTNLLDNAKKLMKSKALESHLPIAANKQVALMMQQIAESMNWEIDMKQSLVEESSLRPLIQEKNEG